MQKGWVKKFIRGLTVLMMAAVIIMSPACFSMGKTYADETETQSSFEYKNYKEHEDYRKALRSKMSRVYDALNGKMVDNRTVPVPGIVETCVMMDGEAQTSANYIPQGLCKVNEYMLVTAYDVKKQLNSVIYVIDITEKTLVSTLTLPNKYHAGGIAFDGENIWMTGDTSDTYKGSPFVQYMTLDTFQEHIRMPVSEIRKSEISPYIYIKNKPSFLECDNDTLWVGTYMGRKNTAEAYMNGYKIIGEPGNRKLNTLMYTVIAGFDSSAQGADIEGDYLYVSSSYKSYSRSLKTSFVTKYDLKRSLQQTGNYYVEGHEIKRIEVPKMNEEIIVEGSTIHINFESGARYWKTAVINTDRVLAVDESLWRLP